MRFDIDALISAGCLIVSIAIMAIMFGGWRMNLRLPTFTPSHHTFVEAPARSPQRRTEGYVESRVIEQ